MVNLEARSELGEIYSSNVRQWYKEHPGQYVLIAEEGKDIRFFKKKRKLEKTIEKEFSNSIGSNLFYKHLPDSNTHRFNEGNTRFYFNYNKFVKYCPNDKDKEIPLRKKSRVSTRLSSSGDKPIYKEHLYCEDCGCFIVRKPSKKAIKEWDKRMEGWKIGNSQS